MNGKRSSVDTTETVLTVVSAPSFAPLEVKPGEVFIVPENAQLLYRIPIVVHGELRVEGELVEV